MIKIFDSNKPGSNLVIMAGVHGDETGGLDAFKMILPTFKIDSGKVTFIIGNPKAVSINKRNYETNLNRMFRPDNELTKSEMNSYEYRRSRELTPILSEADALLDIHSSTTEQTVPFIICEPQSYNVALSLPAEVVVSGIDALHPTGTDAFVNQTGGLGICIECGYLGDKKTTTIATTAIHDFIHYFKTKDGNIQARKSQRYITANWIYKNKDVFKLSRDFIEFEQVQKGEVIGLDGTTEITAPDSGVIMFPHNRTEKNTEAFVFGKELPVK